MKNSTWNKLNTKMLAAMVLVCLVSILGIGRALAEVTDKGGADETTTDESAGNSAEKDSEADADREKKAEEEEKGFVSLFDGKTLKGWQGATDGYKVIEGALTCTPEGGNLYTEKEYADFHLKFEFLLTPGANNGLGVRTPLKGDPAYVGMELQVLDNTAEVYAQLKPWQYHGSVYGVVPAKRGHLKKPGEWNKQEVICRGSHVMVRLNGTTIVDADVKKASTPMTADGKEHPGLDRKKGHLAFCGHGARVAFRKIRIKVLEEPPTKEEKLAPVEDAAQES